MPKEGTVEAVPAGEIVHLQGQDETVAAKCGENRGRWICSTHDTGAFGNNLEKDQHISQPGHHRMVWLCLTHSAIEEP